jgi:hypothetical protein
MAGHGASPRGALVVWPLYGILTAGILGTYALVSPAETYHISHEGIAGGVRQALTFSNFSHSFGALAILGIVVARLLDVPRDGRRCRRPMVNLLAAVALLLCLITALPGMGDQGDLDAKPINAVPAASVLLILGLTVYAWRTRGTGSHTGRPPRSSPRARRCPARHLRPDPQPRVSE